jgi:hypothetical protein
VEWQAWFSEHPFGDDLRDFMLAQLTAVLVNINSTKKSGSASQPKDWLPLYREPEQTPDQMKMLLRGVLRGIHNR